MSESEITVSEGVFYDPGGLRNYGNSLNFSQTIRPRKISSVEPQILLQTYDQINLNTYSQKKNLLRQYIASISLVNEKRDERVITSSDRRIVFNAILNLSITNLSQTKENISLLSNSIKNISSSNFDYLSSFVQFVLKNEDGFKLIEYFNSIIPKFKDKNHMSVLRLCEMIFNDTRDLDSVKLIMDGYIQFIPRFAPNDQLASLEAYLDIFNSKVQSRNREIHNIETDHEREIASINSDYERRLIEAQSKAYETRAKKAAVKFPAVYIFLSSLGAISFLALLLVLLSLQRTLRAIKIKLDE
jgi:hypothetical protein